jgi:hypothetical protein
MDRGPHGNSRTGSALSDVELHGGEIVAASQGGTGLLVYGKLPLLGMGEMIGAPLQRHPKASDGLANVLLGRLDRIKVPGRVDRGGGRPRGPTAPAVGADPDSPISG